MNVSKERLAQIYDLGFWFCASSAFLCSVLSLIGCADLQAGIDAATKPGPDGQSAATKAVEAVPRVVLNPLDVPAWLQILGFVGTIVGTAYAAHTRGKHAATTDAIDSVADTVTDLADRIHDHLDTLPTANSAPVSTK